MIGLKEPWINIQIWISKRILSKNDYYHNYNNKKTQEILDIAGMPIFGLSFFAIINIAWGFFVIIKLLISGHEW